VTLAHALGMVVLAAAGSYVAGWVSWHTVHHAAACVSLAGAGTSVAAVAAGVALAHHY
jgi:hypothetical protein